MGIWELGDQALEACHKTLYCVSQAFIYIYLISTGNVRLKGGGTVYSITTGPQSQVPIQ